MKKKILIINNLLGVYFNCGGTALSITKTVGMLFCSSTLACSYIGITISSIACWISTSLNNLKYLIEISGICLKEKSIFDVEAKSVEFLSSCTFFLNKAWV